LRRVRLLINKPPATPTAAAPTATAGPVALLATPLIVPVAPSREARPFELARVAVRLLAPLDFAVLRVVRFVPLAFAVRVCDARFLAALPPDFALAFGRFEVLVFGWGSAIPRSSWFTRPDG
jgi:hypothetical protein